MRRLPIYFVIDVSESMVGEPLRLVEQGMHDLVKSLSTDPYALETVYVSVIAFAGRACTLLPLTELCCLSLNHLPLGGGTSYGAALDYVMKALDKEVVKTTSEVKGDWKPLVFFFTDGNPTDRYQDSFSRWKSRYAKRAMLHVMSLSDNIDYRILGQLTESIYLLKNMDEESFSEFFKWISSSVQSNSVSIASGEEKEDLDEIPDEDVVEKVNLNEKYQANTDEKYLVLDARCSQEKKDFLIKLEKKNKGYFIENTYSIRDINKYKELSGGNQGAGSINLGELNCDISNFSCPCCRSTTIVFCGVCGKTGCYLGHGNYTCPHCGTVSDVRAADLSELNLSRTKG